MALNGKCRVLSHGDRAQGRLWDQHADVQRPARGPKGQGIHRVIIAPMNVVPLLTD